MFPPPAVLSRFSQLKVLAIGDLILDRYWWGDASRLSPEAPVPVLLKKRITSMPGGAANSAANAAALGASVSVAGIVGGDREGQELVELLRQRSLEPLVSIVDSRATTTKTRIIAGHQHLLRVDAEETSPIPPHAATQLLAAVLEKLPSVDCVLISDYAKGLLSPETLATILRNAKAAGVPTFVDPKKLPLECYAEATCLKPNRMELGLLAGQTIRTHEDTIHAGRRLRDRLPGTSLLVTEAADGMTYWGANGEAEIHVHSEARQVFDITGAGDTVLAAFGLAMAAGAPPKTAMEIASVAAALTIAVPGCAAVTAAEIAAAFPSRR